MIALLAWATTQPWKKQSIQVLWIHLQPVQAREESGWYESWMLLVSVDRNTILIEIIRDLLQLCSIYKLQEKSKNFPIIFI